MSLPLTYSPAVTQRIHLTASAVPSMRRVLAAHLRLWERDAVSDAALLCLTELLGNVIAHCPLDPWVTIRTCPTERGVRIEVFDSIPKLPVYRPRRGAA